MDKQSDEFVTLLTQSQAALYGRILSLLPDRVAAQDVLQETNLTLWHKSEEFEPGTNFLAWACRIARYHVMNFRRKSARDKHVYNENLFRALCERQAEQDQDTEYSLEHLRGCLARLPQSQQDLLRERYSPTGSVKAIAERQGQSVGAISQLLYRIREALLNCVTHRLLEAQR